MGFFILLYFGLQLVLSLASIISYIFGEDALPTPNTHNDRTWWKYTKLSTYWILFGIAQLPWIIGKNTSIRSLFKKE